MPFALCVPKLDACILLYIYVLQTMFTLSAKPLYNIKQPKKDFTQRLVSVRINVFRCHDATLEITGRAMAVQTSW